MCLEGFLRTSKGNSGGMNFHGKVAVILKSNQQTIITVTVSQQICESPVTEVSLNIQNIQLRWIK